MQLTKLAGALLAVALLTGSAAAMPGAAPAQAADNAETNETGASATQEADGDRISDVTPGEEDSESSENSTERIETATPEPDA